MVYHMLISVETSKYLQKLLVVTTLNLLLIWSICRDYQVLVVTMLNLFLFSHYENSKLDGYMPTSNPLLV